MNLFVNSVTEHKIVVGQGQLKKCGDTIETKCNRKISFPNTLVSRRKNNGVIAVDVYRKPTDRYRDFNSHHDSQNKVSTVSTLLQRALNLPNSSKEKKRELNYVHAALSPMVTHLSSSKTYRLKKIDPGRRISFISKTSFNRGLLNRGSTVPLYSNSYQL